jgi:hypothetical protein
MGQCGPQDRGYAPSAGWSVDDEICERNFWGKKGPEKKELV